MIEIIGLLASIIVILSMCISSSNTKGNIIMRIVNIVGSALFIYYGFALSAPSTIIVNFGAVIINIVYIVRLTKNS